MKKKKRKKPIELVGRRTWSISPVTRIKKDKKKSKLVRLWDEYAKRADQW